MQIMTWRGMGCLLTSILMLNGCAFHSESREKQGKEVTDSYPKISYADKFKTIRANREKILTEQFLLVDGFASTQRDGLIRTFALNRKSSVADMLDMLATDTGSTTVSGDTSPEDLVKLGDAQDKIRSAQNSINTSNAVKFALSRAPMPTCAQMLSDPPDVAALNTWKTSNEQRASALEAVITSYKGNCGKIKNANAVIAQIVPKGQIAKVEKALTAEKAALETLTAAQAAARADVNSYIGTEPGTDEKKPKTTLESAKAALAKLEAAQDAISVQFLSETKIAAINSFIDTVTTASSGDPATADTPKPDAYKTELVAALFPEIWKSTKEQLDAAKSVSLAPYITQKKIAQISLDSATRDIETRKTRIKLLTAQKSILSTMAAGYAEVQLMSGKLPDATLKASMVSVLNVPQKGQLNEKASKVLDEKFAVWDIVTRYFDITFRLRPQVDKLQLQLNALQSEIALGYSESSVMQWDALLGATTEQLALYSTTGTKGEEISNLVNAILLLNIGVK